MSRPRGSIIGAKPSWTTTSTSGVWPFRQAEEMLDDGKWPRGPVAPTSLAGTGADTEVALTWVAPATAHGTITNYAVEYTPSGGSATVVLTDSTAESYTVTGLTNDTEYTFRVAAINHTQGEWSTSVAVTPSATANDPDFANVSLLMHFDSDFSDSSSNSLTPTNSGVVISSAQSKFGGSSAYFDGSSRYFNFNNETGFQFATGDFAIEFFLYLLSTADANLYESRASATGSTSDKVIIGIYSAGLYFGATGYILGPNNLTTGQWYYIALARDSGSTRLYVDGTQVGSTYADTNSYNNFGAAPVLGMYLPNANSDLYGYIDELRITKGSSRGYTGATIPVPTEAFPDS